MAKDYKKIAYNELLRDLKADLECLIKEKEILEIEREKLNAKMVLYKRIKRDNKEYEPLYDEVRQNYNNFSFNDIDNKIEDANNLVTTMEEIMLYEF